MIIKRKLIFDSPEQREFEIPWKKYAKYGMRSVKDHGLRKGIRKLRFKISDDIDKSIKANEKAHKALDEYTNNTEFPKRSEVMEALGQEAKKRGIVVIKGKKEYKQILKGGEKIKRSSYDRSEPWAVPKEYIKKKDIIKYTKSNFPEDRELGKALSKGKAVINQKGSQAVLAHDIGHIMNRSKTKTGIVSKVNDVTKSIYQDSRNKKGLGNYLLTSATGKILLKEEKNATKNAMSLLKSANATPNEMIAARKELGADFGTYMHGYKASKGRILKGVVKPNRIKKKNKKRR